MNIYKEFKRLHMTSLKNSLNNQQLRNFKLKVGVIINSNVTIVTFFWGEWRECLLEKAWNDFLSKNNIEKSLENLIRLGYYD